MASPRERAASIATARFSLSFFWPMNSARRCGRSFNSNEESSPTGAADTRRSRLGSTSTLFLAISTDPDSRTKYEGAQLWLELSCGKFPCETKSSVFRPFGPLVAAERLLGVPIQQAHFDASPF